MQNNERIGLTLSYHKFACTTDFKKINIINKYFQIDATIMSTVLNC